MDRQDLLVHLPPRLPLALTALCLLLVASFPVAEAAPRHVYAQDRIIVAFEPGATRLDRRRAVVAGTGSRTATTSIGPRVYRVELEEGASVQHAIETLSRQPGVAYAEPDYHVKPAEVPDDPWYGRGEQWGMYGDETVPHTNPFGTGAGEAWAHGHVGSADVHVAIIDEGIDVEHPDLAPNTWRNPLEVRNGIDDDGNGYVDDLEGWDFYHDDASVYDGRGDDHGTHVAGIIGARGGNGIGVAGTAWRVTLVPAKFLGPKGGYVSDAVRAIDYVVDLKVRHGLTLVAANASWTGGGYSQALHDAIGRAGDAGILFVTAAGNEDRDIDADPAYPASYRCTTRADGRARGWDCLLAVTAITPAGERHPGSDWGADDVDLGAPGSDIVSTDTDDDGYGSRSGTSMSAPHVTGAAALCAATGPALSAREIRERLLATTVPSAALAGRTVSGGRLDIGSLVGACVPAPPPPPPVPDRPTIVVDELDDAFRRYGAAWQEGWNGYAGHHYWLPARDGARTHYGAWRPRLPEAGWYDIEVRIPVSHATSRRATYRIRTEDGWVTRIRDQEKRAGTWVSLGIHRLTTTPIVQLSDRTGEPESLARRLAWDAARFVPVDGPPT